MVVIQFTVPKRALFEPLGAVGAIDSSEFRVKRQQ
jgi:hypothetical protein